MIRAFPHRQCATIWQIRSLPSTAQMSRRHTFLGPFVEKPMLASFCLTEPGAGSDNSAMTTFIKKGADGTYLLNGSKCFITNASYASQFTVFCKVGKPSSNFMACVIVPALPRPAFRQEKYLRRQGNNPTGRGKDHHRQAGRQTGTTLIKHSRCYLRRCCY